MDLRYLPISEQYSLSAATPAFAYLPRGEIEGGGQLGIRLLSYREWMKDR